MQNPAQDTTDKSQVHQVRAPNDRIGRTVEIERQRQPARCQHTRNLVDGPGKIRNVPQPVSRRDKIERTIGKRQRQHVPDKKRT